MADPAGFERQRAAGFLTVEAYVGSGYRVDGRDWPGVLVTPFAAFEFKELTLAAFAPLAGLEPAVDVVLIGTGATMSRPPAELLDGLRRHGWAPEFMTSRAAARTFNVVVGEGRQVAAALPPS